MMDGLRALIIAHCSPLLPKGWEGTIRDVTDGVLTLDTDDGPVTFEWGPHLEIRPRI